MSNEINSEEFSSAQYDFVPEEHVPQEPSMDEPSMGEPEPFMGEPALGEPAIVSQGIQEGVFAEPDPIDEGALDFPREEHVWSYSLRDLTDEIFWAAVFLTIWAQLFYPSLTGVGYWGYFNIVITVLFGIGIIYFAWLYSAFDFFFKSKVEEKVVNGETVKLRRYRWSAVPKFLLLLLACVLLGVRAFSIEFPDQTSPAGDAPVHEACAFSVEMTAAQETADAVPAETEAVEVSEEVSEEVPAETAAETAAETETEEVSEETAAETAAETETEEISEETAAETAAETETEEVSEETAAETAAETKTADETANVTSTEATNGFWASLTSICPKTWDEAIRGFFILFLGIGVWCYVFSLLGRIFFGKFCTWYRLTPTVLICRSGFFITKEQHIAVWDIQRVEMERNLWQRILGVGTLELHVRDGSLMEMDSLEGNESADVSTPDNIVHLPGIRMHGLFTSSCREVDILNEYRLFLRSRMGGRMLNPMGVASSGGNQRMELDAYFRNNFAERANQKVEWKYRPRDLTDEGFYAAIFALLGGGIQLGMPSFQSLSFLLYAISGCVVLWILYLLIIRYFFTKYQLDDCHFTYTTGVLTQRLQSIAVTDIVQITLTRSWWERIIRTGTLRIRFRTATGLKPNPLVIRGIGRYSEMFETLDYYRMYHRLVQYFGMSV